MAGLYAHTSPARRTITTGPLFAITRFLCRQAEYNQLAKNFDQSILANIEEGDEISLEEGQLRPPQAARCQCKWPSKGRFGDCEELLWAAPRATTGIFNLRENHFPSESGALLRKLLTFAHNALEDGGAGRHARPSDFHIRAQP